MIEFRIFTLALALCGILSGAAQAEPDKTLGVAMLAARVAADGTLINGAGATGAHTISGSPEGYYEVDFNRDVSNCFYNAVSDDLTVPYIIEPRAGVANGVFVEFSTLGSPSAGPTTRASRFYMTVYCVR